MYHDWKKYLQRQAVLHPVMEPQDVYKLLFQAVFGAEHLVQNKEVAYTYFQEEYDATMPKEECLYEQIHETIYRVSLREWKRRKLPQEWLFQMFVGSVENKFCNAKEAKQLEQEFYDYVQLAKEAVCEGMFSFSEEAFFKYTQEYEKTGPKAVHHSEKYRKSECPAYRLVDARYMRVLPILEALAEWRLKSDATAVVAIDGRCASGKSTMAKMLSQITGAGLIHMDDFFLPQELRTEERGKQPGGNVHYERFLEEVLPQLREEREFSYRRFDCGAMKPGEKRTVLASPIRIVEGAYSCHPIFGSYADLTVFSDVETKEQLIRIERRDGGKVLSRFIERWIPMEENYIREFSVPEKADIIV